MDYEQKYNEALEIAQKLYQDCPNGKNDRLYHTTDLEKMFPELRESEDEKIRKELIEHIKDQQSSFISAPDCRDKYEEEENNKYNSWLAWLEKQGKKNSVTTKEEEKVREQVVYAINKLNVPESEKNKLLAWLEKQGEQKPFDYENADIQQKDFAPKETVKEAESNLTPLERKVKDILFSFHINAADGISFDGTMAIVHNLITLCQQEQKPADKIKPKFKVGDKVIGIVSDMQYYITDVCYDHYYTESGCIIMFCSQDNFKLVEQKPAWSEEDEKMVANLVDYFKVDDALQYTEKQVVDWLKSLKQKIKGE